MYAEHFSIDNIPYGIATSASHVEQSVVTRLGDTVIFLNELAKAGSLPGINEAISCTFSEVSFAHYPYSFPLFFIDIHVLTFP